ncbi:hypothetical protein [Streptomyces sp. P9-A2]
MPTADRRPARDAAGGEDDETVSITLTRDQAFVLSDWLYQVIS